MGEEKKTRILAIDVGSVRVGLAISDELRLTAQPLTVLPRQPQTKLFQRLQEIIVQNNVDEIIVGLPVNLSGEETPATVETKRFVELLKRKFPNLKITCWDERFTTTASENLLIDAGMRRNKRRAVIDKIAAALILKSYLENNPPHPR
ncbi:MAG: Holliday junction resolvase RuvX [Candidatus Sumerlaeia bacterium]|nr:Holliday junction resolvase RuvX [Candidatus Sumerlaeia bacterium]